MTYNDLINDLISYKLQMTLRDNIKKIYPVRVCQIRSMYIEKEKKHGEEEEVKAEKEKKTIKKKNTEEIKVEESSAKEKEAKEEKTEVEEKVIEKRQKEEKIEVKEITEVKKEEIPNTHDLAKNKEEKAESGTKGIKE